ncbi:hypothetical protein [Pelosinus sp. IPA-1]|uniref:hypothetical protein n=1 Tax=Pelosinus sp. IPA-1 TaxID=3029569 RepID=UPI0024361E06|nr:hypothetical protein [Pelosinus sp. IPA-1]GMA98479.1 hypothetical protein PIPA1_12790 [Pelosinus sp. IPA-1]
MWQNIRQFIYFPNMCIGIYTVMFIFVWLAAWILNGIKGTNFDVNQLRDTYIWLMTQLNATHAINSIWNSPKGAGVEGIRIKENIPGKPNSN